MAEQDIQNEKMETAVIFRSEGGLYAFRIDVLLEIITRSEFTSVPCLPDCIIGVINRMGDVIPVIDLRLRLGFPAPEEYGGRSCLMVINSRNTVAAVRVDEAVTSVSLENNFIPLDDDSVIEGITHGENGERISVIDADKLLSI
ncbi:purine-binding chemotaxis protein CheW [Ruminococcus sp. YE71]|uniref:chemotaxis protein CheW n=1 Tax=unclassified Ruminococcus TaxID=2608920 RepID=UPI00089199E6|nr:MULTISPECIES: chemotaxis protein CheW [unclassified Ruminococcus]SDA15545.1 purine-binding chemotaxis protein CheW [Ruminococcus sp. YE78]SFW22751.1 purine-binding chemotaxis protein CheW [Ruminococcus sp. YE71]